MEHLRKETWRCSKLNLDFARAVGAENSTRRDWKTAAEIWTAKSAISGADVVMDATDTGHPSPSIWSVTIPRQKNWTNSFSKIKEREREGGGNKKKRERKKIEKWW